MYVKIPEIPCHKFCFTCSDTNTALTGCLSCDLASVNGLEDTGVPGSLCELNCAENEAKIDNEGCEACSVAGNVQCIACDDNTKACTACSEGYALDSLSICILVCEENEVYNETLQICESCSTISNPHC